MDKKNFLLLELPDGVGQHDVEGVLNGYSKAVDKGNFRVSVLAKPYGLVTLGFKENFVLVPVKDVVDMRITNDSGGQTRVEPTIVTSPQNARLLNAAIFA